MLFYFIAICPAALLRGFAVCVRIKSYFLCKFHIA